MGFNVFGKRKANEGEVVRPSTPKAAGETTRGTVIGAKPLPRPVERGPASGKRTWIPGLGPATTEEIGQKGLNIEKLPLETKILIVTLGISIVLLAFAFLSHNFGVLANVIILCTFVVASPQFILMYQRFRDMKIMEEKFPVFLRDVIEQLQSGMPLHKSIISVGGYDYGKLSPFVKKMAIQLSWGMELDRVLSQFAQTVKTRKRLYADVKTIQESYKSGGDLASALTTVADNANLIEDTEKEKSSLLNQYVILMYAICFVFIGIVVAINNLMVPIFKISAEAGGMGGQVLGIANPCSSCNGFMCSICGLYTGTSEVVFSLDPTNISAYYVALFFYMSIVQSIFSGLVAGQIGENSVKAGIKHSLILVSATVGTFYFLIYLKILGV